MILIPTITTQVWIILPNGDRMPVLMVGLDEPPIGPGKPIMAYVDGLYDVGIGEQEDGSCIHLEWLAEEEPPQPRKPRFGIGEPPENWPREDASEQYSLFR